MHIRNQTLELFDKDQNIIVTYPVASAKNGIGQREGSECTPLGEHIIAEKFGELAPINTVFVGRQATGEIYSNDLALAEPNRDWILTRILWLKGSQVGFNQGYDALGNSCDTQGRYIYIHGCPDSHAMQIPSSHGCIKMRNTDMIDLFDKASVGDVVTIS